MKASDTKTAEAIRPYLVSIAVAAGTFYWLRGVSNWTPTVKELFPSTLNISAIMIGFLATAKSIMFSLGDNQRVRALRSSGQFGLLITYLLWTTLWSFCVAITSALNVVLYPNKTHSAWLVTAWVFSITAASVWFYKVVRMLARLLRQEN